MLQPPKTLAEFRKLLESDAAAVVTIFTSGEVSLYLENHAENWRLALDLSNDWKSIRWAILHDYNAESTTWETYLPRSSYRLANRQGQAKLRETIAEIYGGNRCFRNRVETYYKKRGKWVDS